MIDRIFTKLKRIVLKFYYQRKFGKCGSLLFADSLLRLDGGENIFIGSRVSLNYKIWLAAVPLTGNVSRLIIQDGVILGDFNHIYCTGSIIIEKDVLTANFVYISDNLHSFDNIHIPIKDQPIKQTNHVVIGEGSWIGEHVSIIGASVGKHSVIGANSTVTHDIPDYCVAVGSPAYIIKRFDFDLQSWRKTNKNGNFI